MHVNGYYFILLHKESAVSLRTLAKFPDIYCHHVTVAFKPDIEQSRVLDTLVGSKYDFKSIELVEDDKCQALSVDLQTNNEHSHITISCAKGVKPVYSNTLLATPKTTRPYVVQLSGVLKFESF